MKETKQCMVCNNSFKTKLGSNRINCSTSCSRAYIKSPKYIEYLKQCHQSDKYKTYQKQYRESGKGKASQKKYIESKKGKVYLASATAKINANHGSSPQ